MTAEPLLDRETEQTWAETLRDSRLAVCARFLDLPHSVRRTIASDDPEGPELGAAWPLDRLEAWVARLETYAARAQEPAVAAVLESLRGPKRALDQAREVLVRANLRLVPVVVRRLGHGGSRFLDLVQEGNLGLLQALDRFDPSRGFRFSTYAFWWIRRALSNASGVRLIRLPGNVRADQRVLRKARAELERRLGRTPGLHELARQANLSLERVRALEAYVAALVPLEATDDRSDGRDLLSRLADDGVPTPLDALLGREDCRELMRALELLPPRERRVVKLRYGIQQERAYSLREVADEMRLSRERVRQIEVEALRRIRVRTAVRRKRPTRPRAPTRGEPARGRARPASAR